MLPVATLFALLGPLFLVLGGVAAARHRRITARARTWLLLGAIFSATAVWLHLRVA